MQIEHLTRELANTQELTRAEKVAKEDITITYQVRHVDVA